MNKNIIHVALTNARSFVEGFEGDDSQEPGTVAALMRQIDRASDSLAYPPAPGGVSLIESIDAFPILADMRDGMKDGTMIECSEFVEAAKTRGHGATMIALFVLDLHGFTYSEPGLAFSLFRLFSRIDTPHRHAAIGLFAKVAERGTR